MGFGARQSRGEVDDLARVYQEVQKVREVEIGLVEQRGLEGQRARVE